jgi:hypothetical protein
LAFTKKPAIIAEWGNVPDERTSDQLLIEAEVVRHHAKRFRDAVTRVHDDLVAIALQARAVELDNLATTLERQAGRKL